jgi:hypothetical protein
MKIEPESLSAKMECPECGDTQFVSFTSLFMTVTKGSSFPLVVCHKCAKVMKMNEINYRDRDITGKDLGELLSTYVNQMNIPDENDFIDGCIYQHRTLQQSLFRIIWKLIERWAEFREKENFDLRNEGTVKTCHKIVSKLGDEVYLPFV